MYNNPSRVLRGGSWFYPPSLARVAFRPQVAPGVRLNGLGVRIVRMINPLQQIAEVKNGQ